MPDLRRTKPKPRVTTDRDAERYLQEAVDAGLMTWSKRTHRVGVTAKGHRALAALLGYALGARKFRQSLVRALSATLDLPAGER